MIKLTEENCGNCRFFEEDLDMMGLVGECSRITLNTSRDGDWAWIENHPYDEQGSPSLHTDFNFYCNLWESKEE